LTCILYHEHHISIISYECIFLVGFGILKLFRVFRFDVFLEFLGK